MRNTLLILLFVFGWGGDLFAFPSHMKSQVDEFMKIKKKIKKDVKVLNKETKFSIRTSKFGSNQKYNFYQNVVPKHCQFGIEQQVHESKNNIFRRKDGKGVLNRTGSIEVDDDLDIWTKDYDPSKNMGYSIRFNDNLGKTKEMTLNFKSKSERDKAKIALNAIQRLCRDKKRQLRNLISAGVDPIELGEVGKRAKGALGPGYNYNPYDLTKFNGRGFKANPGLSIPKGKEFGPFPYRNSSQDRVEVGALGGEKSYMERYWITRDAKRSIDVLNLHLLADEAGITLGKLLIKKKKEGLKIRVYIDGLTPFIDIRETTNRINSYRLYKNLMAHGIPVWGYQCDSKFQQLKQEFMATYKYKGRRFMHRFHEKIWIADDKIAIVGGANISNHYHMLYPKGRNRWRDMDVVIKGKKMIGDLKARIDEKIVLFEKDIISPTKQKCFNKNKVGSSAYQSFVKENFKNYLHVGKKENPKEHDFALKYAETLQKGKYGGKTWRVRFAKTKGSRVIFSRPKFGDLFLEKVYIHFINNSKYEVLLENSYFIPSPQLLDALVRASQRGVKIKIITNGPETNDPPIVMTPLARFYYKDLMDINQGNKRHDIELYEWNGRYKGSQKVEFGMVHAKFGVFDRKITLVGSYNFDNISRDFNEEVAVVFEGEELALYVAKRFYEYDLNYTSRIKYQEALKFKQPRNFGQRMLLKILRKYEGSL